MSLCRRGWHANGETYKKADDNCFALVLLTSRVAVAQESMQHDDMKKGAPRTRFRLQANSAMMARPS
jgi:hypothetical protein